MTSVTVHLEDSVLKRLGSEATNRGVSVEQLVEQILNRHALSVAEALDGWFERARREGWQSDGPYLTDDEMYSR